MITSLPNADRTRWRGAWVTFTPSTLEDRPGGGFGALQQLSEYRLAPGGRIYQGSDKPCEIVTYVCEGALAYDDSLGRRGVAHIPQFINCLLYFLNGYCAHAGAPVQDPVHSRKTDARNPRDVIDGWLLHQF